MVNVLADLAVESEATTTLMMRLAGAFDDERQQTFRRLALAVAKYWCCKRAIAVVARCAGVPRAATGTSRNRSCRVCTARRPLNSIWEGSGNVKRAGRAASDQTASRSRWRRTSPRLSRARGAEPPVRRSPLRRCGMSCWILPTPRLAPANRGEDGDGAVQASRCCDTATRRRRGVLRIAPSGWRAPVGTLRPSRAWLESVRASSPSSSSAGPRREFRRAGAPSAGARTQNSYLVVAQTARTASTTDAAWARPARADAARRAGSRLLLPIARRAMTVRADHDRSHASAERRQLPADLAARSECHAHWTSTTTLSQPTARSALRPGGHRPSDVPPPADRDGRPHERHPRSWPPRHRQGHAAIAIESSRFAGFGIDSGDLQRALRPARWGRRRAMTSRRIPIRELASPRSRTAQGAARPCCASPWPERVNNKARPGRPRPSWPRSRRSPSSSCLA